MAIVLFVVYLLGMVAEFRLTETMDRRRMKMSPVWVNIVIGVTWPLLVAVALVHASVFPDAALDLLCGEISTNEDN